MQAVLRSGVVMLTAALLCVAFVAHAVVRGHYEPPADSAQPQHHPVCLSGDCSENRQYLMAAQSNDCNLAGPGTPSLVQDDGSAFFDNDSLFSGAATVGAGHESLYVKDTLKLGDLSLNFGYRIDRSVMSFPDPAGIGMSSWPGADSNFSDFGSSKGPNKAFFGGSNGVGEPIGAFGFPVPFPIYGSLNFPTPAGGVPANVAPFVNQQVDFNGFQYTSLGFDAFDGGYVENLLEVVGIIAFEINGCRVVLTPTDPNFRSSRRGFWGDIQDDQWAIKRVGFTADENSAWNHVPENASEVIVAVIDTGLDWHHLDFSHENIWRNEKEIPDNGRDDDRNGYVDDVIGWDFYAESNKPWDFDGHGTIVAGIIAAAQDNDAGIAGINPHAKVMVLKAVNNFGTSRASYLAEAIVYAVDNGARVINISVGGPFKSQMEQAAIDYANERGVLVVAASGNDGAELDNFGPGGYDKVLTVGATHVDDRAAAFSNYGDQVDLVAPGVDVLSLRARYTDANYRPGSGQDYEVGANFVGDDKRYISVSGTSFSTPIVAATASLLLSKNPELTASEVEARLFQTATDVEAPGKDKYTGYGMVNATAALAVDTDFSVTAEITALQFVQTEGAEFIRVVGTIDASDFKRAWMQIGPGMNPGAWKYVGQKRKFPIVNGTLGTIPVNQFAGADVWQVVINVEHGNGVVKRAVYPIRIK